MFRVTCKTLAATATIILASLSQLGTAFAVEVYLFRGAGDLSFVREGLNFSRGLEKIADQLNKEGIHAEVRRFGAMDDALRTIDKRKPKTVAFIGHSMGALASMNMARKMREAGIKVAYMGLIDIPGPVGVAGDNIEWVENFYSMTPVYGRLTNTNEHPNAHNIHITGFMHNRMDDSPEIQSRMLAAIRSVHRREQAKEVFVEAPVLTPSQSPKQTPSVVNSFTQPIKQPSDIMQPVKLPMIEGYSQLNDEPALSYERPVVDSMTTSSVDRLTIRDRARSLISRARQRVRDYKYKNNE